MMNTMKDSAAYIQGWLRAITQRQEVHHRGISQSSEGSRLHFRRRELIYPFFMRITLFNLELPRIKTHTQAPLMLSFPKLEHTFLSPHSKAQIFTFN
jgi:hypothetical protein